MLNKVILIGNVGKDPEVQYIGEGENPTQVARFTLATSESYKNKQGEKNVDLLQIDRYTIRGNNSYLTGYVPVNQSGDINVVVEIPTGSTEKWEVTKPDGELKWEFKDGKPRIVKYLGYPGNYGMIPQTLLPEDRGPNFSR